MNTFTIFLESHGLSIIYWRELETGDYEIEARNVLGNKIELPDNEYNQVHEIITDIK